MNRIHFLNQLAAASVRYNLGAGIPPLHLYPDFSPEENLRSFRETFPEKNMLQYHSTEGFIGELAIKTLSCNENLQASPRNILITNGVQEAIALTALAFREKTIACCVPYYPGLVDAVRQTGNSVCLIQGENWLDKVAELPEGSLFYLSADFSNPSGTSFSLSERKDLIEIAERRDLMLFDDATYREFYLDEKMPSLYSLHSERVIHALSFSKILGPGLRTAFIYLPEKWHASYTSLKANSSLNNAGLTQAITGGWLIRQNYQLRSHLGKVLHRLKENQTVLMDAGSTYNGGFFARMNLAEPKASFEWCEKLLREEGVAICPMLLFSDDPAMQSVIRLAVANSTPSDLNMVLEIIRNFR